MSVEIRDLTPDDDRAAAQLSHEAFGAARPGPDDLPRPPRPGATTLGAFVAGQLVAKVVGLDHRLWFGGREVVSMGLAGVTVLAEHRGRGLLSPLLAELFARGRAQGAVVSTQYPTAPGIYRRFGYELIGSLVSAEVPTTQLLPGPAADAGVRVRRVTDADLAAVAEVCTAWARSRNGALTRRGPVFPEHDPRSGHSTAWLAERDGRVIGCCLVDRGTGDGPGSVQEVEDLIATEPDGYRALLTVLASNHSVTGRTVVETSLPDPVRLLVPGAGWTETKQHSYMLALLDAAAALTARGWPPLGVGLDLVVDDRALRLELDGQGGAAVSELAGPSSGAPRFTARGLAVAYAGAQPCASLRATGLLAGPEDTDTLLDAVMAGTPGVRDYF